MRTAHFLLLTSALVLNSSAFAAESHELMMCNTYSGGGGVSVKGFVFNGLDLSRQRHRFGYQGYHYQYKYSA